MLHSRTSFYVKVNARRPFPRFSNLNVQYVGPFVLIKQTKTKKIVVHRVNYGRHSVSIYCLRKKTREKN